MESVSPDEKGPTVTHEVGLSNVDATLDVIASSSGLVSSLSQGAFRHLRSAVRANTGAKAGRYYFEVQVLERVLDAPLLLLLGFSLDRSSLFLASSESVGFDSKGSSVSSIKAPSSTSDLGKAKRIGLLLDQDVKDGSVSVFLDGQQTRSVAIPQLHGKALFPTLTFQNVTLAVSFQAPGPERSRAFGQILEEHHVRSSIEESPKEVIIPVALPSSGLYDWSLRWREARPDFVEIGDEMMEDWSLSSGLSRARAGGIQSRDDPDMCFGIDELNKREAWHSALMCIARHSKRSLVHSSVRRNLLEVERTTMLDQFPAAKKIAVVLFGEPDEDLRDWVKRRRRSDYEAAKAQLQRRRNAAEAAGEEPPPDDLKEPCDDEVFLPNSKLEVTEQALQRDFQNFSLPSKAEGFDEIRYEWIDEESARAELAQWLRERKAKQVVEDLVPGEWFHRRCEEWKNVRRVFQNGQKDFCTRSQKDDSLLHVASSIDLEDVKDPHDVDGKGTPIYGNFKYEDWVVLSWRFEMHLLCHAFPMDAADPDRQGLPEEHLKHYWELYFHHHFEPRKLGVTNLQGILNVLKEPLTLKETKGGPRIVQSTLDKDTPIEAFVVAVEAYRRDRERRIEAGDESAALKIPRIAKAGPSAAVMKSLPKAGQNGPKVQSKEAAKMPKTSSAEAKENVAKAGAKPEAKPKQPSVAPPKGKAPNLAKVAVVKMPAKRPSPTDHGSAPKRPKPSVAMTK